MTWAFTLRALACRLAFSWDQLLGLGKNDLTVLCYHSFSHVRNRYTVPLPLFAAQLSRLTGYLRFVGLPDLDKVLRGEHSHPRQVILTIDDGYKSVMDILPLTTRYQIPVILFVLSDPTHLDRRALDNQEPLLTWSQIKQLQRAGWTIGCHSATHADFVHLTPKQVEAEIVTSKQVLERRLGSPVTCFAYPKGYHSPLIQLAVARAGYRYAFSLEPGAVTMTSDHLSLPRTIIDRTHAATDLPAAASHTWLKIRQLTNRYQLWERFLS